MCCVWLYTPFDRRGQSFEVSWHSKDRKTPRKPDRRANNWTTEIMASTYQQSKLWPRSHETALQSVLRTLYNCYGDLTYIKHSCLHIFPLKICEPNQYQYQDTDSQLVTLSLYMWIVILFLKTCQGVSFEVAKLHCFELHYHAKMYMYISLQLVILPDLVEGNYNINKWPTIFITIFLSISASTYFVNTCSLPVMLKRVSDCCSLTQHFFNYVMARPS